MKTLYIECSMGAAGDMLMAALLELAADKEQILKQLNDLLPEKVAVTVEPSEKCGVTGSHVHVTVCGMEEGVHDHVHDHGHETGHDGANHAGHGHTYDHNHNHNHFHDHGHHHDSHDCEHNHGHHHDGHTHAHHHSGISEIYALIDAMEVSEKVKTDAKAVYQLIAEAESKVHGKTMEDIHFHEVGTLDAVADVVGNCLLMEKIGAERIVVSPIHVGCGTVRCAHGLLPVPAPATALLLEELPIYGGEVEGELCTPTGAALLKYFGTSFEQMPAMTIEKIGYGMGTKDFVQRPNCVRVLLGDDGAAAGSSKEVVELAANLDDMTGEELGFAMEVLFEEGALDVYFEQIIMKKSRPAVKLVCMCRPEEKEKFAKLILKHTATIGVRAYSLERFTLARSIEKRQTPYGEIDVKVCSGYGITREKAEYEQVAEIARKQNLPFRTVKESVKRTSNE